MKKIAIICLLGLIPAAYAGTYKCEKPDGSVSYQAMPCANSSTADPVTIYRPATKPSTATQSSRSKPALDEINKTSEYQRDIRAAEHGVSREMLDRLEGRTVTKREKRAYKGRVKLKITDTVQRVSVTGKYVHLEGVVKNTGDVSVEFVKVKARALGGRGKLVALDASYSDPSTLGPGQEGTFSIMMLNYQETRRFSYTVQYSQ